MTQQELNALFEKVTRLENDTNSILNTSDVKVKQAHLIQLLSLYQLICNTSISKQGEILTLLRTVCKEAGESFEDFIREKFEISPKTAFNYINVYYYDCRYPGLIESIQPSILYKVCTENFNEALRDFMIKTGILKDKSIKEFKSLVKKYEAGGLDAIQDEVDKINKAHQIMYQTSYILETTRVSLHALNSNLALIERKGNKANNGMCEFTELIKGDHPEAVEIELSLYEANQMAISIIDKAIAEADKRLETFYINQQPE